MSDTYRTTEAPACNSPGAPAWRRALACLLVNYPLPTKVAVGVASIVGVASAIVLIVFVLAMICQVVFLAFGIPLGNEGGVVSWYLFRALVCIGAFAIASIACGLLHCLGDFVLCRLGWRGWRD